MPAQEQSMVESGVLQEQEGDLCGWSRGCREDGVRDVAGWVRGHEKDRLGLDSVGSSSLPKKAGPRCPGRVSGVGRSWSGSVPTPKPHGADRGPHSQKRLPHLGLGSQGPHELLQGHRRLGWPRTHAPAKAAGKRPRGAVSSQNNFTPAPGQLWRVEEPSPELGALPSPGEGGPGNGRREGGTQGGQHTEGQKKTRDVETGILTQRNRVWGKEGRGTAQ